MATLPRIYHPRRAHRDDRVGPARSPAAYNSATAPPIEKPSDPDRAMSRFLARRTSAQVENFLRSRGGSSAGFALSAKRLRSPVAQRKSVMRLKMTPELPVNP